MRSSREEKSFVSKHEGDISAFGADIFLVVSVSYPGKGDGKSFLVFHSIQVFFFSSNRKVFTLHSNKMRFFHYG